eukprot:2372164-Rhodomonas_salina.2
MMNFQFRARVLSPNVQLQARLTKTSRRAPNHRYAWHPGNCAVTCLCASVCPKQNPDYWSRLVKSEQFARSANAHLRFAK